MGDLKADAIAACQRAVLGELGALDADFTKYDNATLSPGAWTVRGTAKYLIGPGTERRITFTCRATYDGAGSFAASVYVE